MALSILRAATSTLVTPSDFKMVFSISVGPRRRWNTFLLSLPIKLVSREAIHQK